MISGLKISHNKSFEDADSYEFPHKFILQLVTEINEPFLSLCFNMLTSTVDR
jgi:hypothetical protein